MTTTTQQLLATIMALPEPERFAPHWYGGAARPAGSYRTTT